RGAGTTHPNPMVGAVIVTDGRIVGEGWHRKPGESHAEALALQEAGSAARGGALFVNLEPCDHTGRTPPCTKAIIDAGIAQVFAACFDPHSLVNGRGFETLREAGVRVTTGPLGREAEELNRAFFHFSREGTPYVTLKLASTMDGRIAAPDGDSKWITGEKARKAVHRLRAQVDAVMVGVGTVIADDPKLTARDVGRKIQPMRVVLDPILRTPPDSIIVRENLTGSTLLVIGEDVPEDRCQTFQDRGVRLLRLPVEEGLFPWSALAGSLAEMGILHVLAEGGGKTAAWMLKTSAVNRLELFLASRVLGASGIPAVGDMGITSMKEAAHLSFHRIRRIGEDVQITADVK
ncbi:bifunctional diaminohydroxyphosphoribosylaminopyrimidine deaminase/5-amino-6-(5-phosphoribosylamino)uracil reductase RibD, partial [bacterium]|nr:bifunctional diaminohydroxyphosphoribosylaminopyrimidine deaminase/5-amino-6-(5-phosphoribosylamino)uracil reductase RibD [bacterium]